MATSSGICTQLCYLGAVLLYIHSITNVVTAATSDQRTFAHARQVSSDVTNHKDGSTFEELHKSVSSRLQSNGWNGAQYPPKAQRRGVFKRYKDFYTALGLKVLDDNSVRKSLLKRVKEETSVEEERDKKVIQDNIDNPPKSIQIMTQLWSAVRDGKTQEKSDQTPVFSRSLGGEIESSLYDGSVLEIGSGVTAIHLTYKHRNTTAIAIVFNDQDHELCQQFAIGLHTLNLNVVKTNPDNLVNTVETLYNDYQVLFSNLILSNLTSLVGELLPHEFEEHIARLLSLSAQTFIANGPIKGKKMMSFFQSWRSTDALIKSACKIAGLHCQVSAVKGNSNHGWHNDDVETARILKVVIHRGIRNLPEPFCHSLLPESQCLMYFTNGSDNVTVELSDGSSMLIPVEVDSIPIHTLMTLKPSSWTREKVFLQMLEVPYNRSINSRNMQLFGHQVIVVTEQDEELSLDLMGETKWLRTQVKNHIELDPSLGDTEEDDHLPQIKNSQDAADYTTGKHSAKSTGKPSSAVKFRPAPAGEKKEENAAQSQVDGIANMWNRENGEIPTDFQKEKQEMQSLSKQWDRENNHHGNKKGKEDNELKTLDETWSRERHNKEDAHKKEKSESPDRRFINTDAIPRRDEREVGQAMGFLHGNSDVHALKPQRRDQIQNSRSKIHLRDRGEDQRQLGDRNVKQQKPMQQENLQIRPPRPVKNKRQDSHNSPSSNKKDEHIQDAHQMENQENPSPNRDVNPKTGNAHDAQPLDGGNRVDNSEKGVEVQQKLPQQENQDADAVRKEVDDNNGGEDKENEDHGKLLFKPVVQPATAEPVQPALVPEHFERVEETPSHHAIQPGEPQEAGQKQEPVQPALVPEQVERVEETPSHHAIQPGEPQEAGQKREAHFIFNQRLQKPLKETPQKHLPQEARLPDTPEKKAAAAVVMEKAEDAEGGEGQENQGADGDKDNAVESILKKLHEAANVNFPARAQNQEQDIAQGEVVPDQQNQQPDDYKDYENEDQFGKRKLLNLDPDKLEMMKKMINKYHLDKSNSKVENKGDRGKLNNNKKKETRQNPQLMKRNTAHNAKSVPQSKQTKGAGKRRLDIPHGKPAAQGTKSGQWSRGGQAPADKKLDKNLDIDAAVASVPKQADKTTYTDQRKANIGARDSLNGAGHFWDKGGVGVGRNAGHDVGTLNQEGEEGNEEDEEDMGEEEDDEYEENEDNDVEFHMFSARNKEQVLYDREWMLLKADFKKMYEQNNHFSLLTVGEEQQSLLGLKVAHTYPQATVVTVMPTSKHRQAAQHWSMMQNVPAENNLLLESDFGPAVLDKLLHMPEIFRVQVIGLPIWRHVVNLGPGFVYYLGQLLTMARTTYLEVPSPQQLLLSEYIIMNASTEQPYTTALFKGIIYEALKLVNAESSEVTLVEDTDISFGMDTTTKLVKVELVSAQRQVTVNCGGYEAVLQLKPEGATIESKGSGIESRLSRAEEAVGLEFILKLTAPGKQTADLFSRYLKLPIHEDMCPAHIVFFNSSLLYSPALSPGTHLHTDREAQRAAEKTALIEVLSQQLDDGPISFMEYGVQTGDVIKSLASSMNASSFLALFSRENKDKALNFYEQLKKQKIENIVVSSLDLDSVFTRKLLESPDFLRYQYIGLEQWFEMMKGMRRGDFNLMVGQTISNAVTTFFQLPSAKALSLAMTTFFPLSYNGQALHPHSSEDKERYLSRNHPTPVYKAAELKLIGESAKADVSINVSAAVFDPRLTSSGSEWPWKVVRVDVRNLTTPVNHHFDYELDGHSRKYVLHCVSTNNTNYEVYLVREMDGFKIPYGKVHAFSLIALLRMGILQEIKENFYEQFIQLPFYEDMAPWNIVFRGGKLDYIDYDTKDVTFDKMVKVAYQVMSVLMNYQRTVQDFGHCHEDAKTDYGFSLVSKCVGSSFRGPCKDSRYPVPCGDNTCKSTYIDCLRAISDMEKKGRDKLDKMVMRMKKPDEEAEAEKSPFDDGKWGFGPIGYNSKRKSYRWRG